MTSAAESSASRTASTLSVARTVALFALAFAVVDLALGVVPVNLMLRRFMGAAMPQVWLVSAIRLAIRAVISATACAVTLRVTGRAGGRLASTMPKGIMSIGAITSGALAGALDVGVHRMLVWPMIHLAQRSRAASELGSALLTAAGVALVASILLVRRTRVVATPASETLQPA
jgi:hypothetical protein